MDKRLLQNFNAAFPNAENVNWDELPNSYIVSFIENGTRTTVQYKKGDMLSATKIMRYYMDKKLPADIHTAVKSIHPGKTIFGITEVTTGPSNSRQTEYYIVLEEERFMTTVKTDKEGNVIVVDTYRKAR
jgi:hypothetical protein